MGLHSLTFVTALTLSGLLTGVARRVAWRIDLLDRPDSQRKLHKRATPLMGGVAVYVTVLTASVAIWFVGRGHLDLDATSARLAGMLLLSGGLLCAIGLWDDKWGLRARHKFLLQIASTLPFVLWGRTISTVALFGVSVDVAWIGIPFTVFWLVSCTNIVNLMDGLDGLASSVSLIACLTVAVLAQLNGLVPVSILALVLAGSLAGFLLHNWPPAQIFLGDSGSQPIGFFVGALALEASVKRATGFMLFVPLVLLSVPIFDTCMAILRRKLNGQTIGQADRAHIHHCLRDRGLTTRQTLFAIGGLSAVMAIASIAAALRNDERIAIGICAIVLAVLVTGRVFGYQEALLLWRHVLTFTRWLRSAPAHLESQFVLLRLQSRRDQPAGEIWLRVVEASRRSHAESVILTQSQPAGARETTLRDWHDDARDDFTDPLPAGDRWQLRLVYRMADRTSLSLEIMGRGPTDQQAQHVETVVQLFSALCRQEIEEPAASESTAEPRILPVHWPRSNGATSDAA